MYEEENLYGVFGYYIVYSPGMMRWKTKIVGDNYINKKIRDDEESAEINGSEIVIHTGKIPSFLTIQR